MKNKKSNVNAETETIMLQLPREFLQRLDQKATEEGVDCQEIVLRALAEYLPVARYRFGSAIPYNLPKR